MGSFARFVVRVPNESEEASTTKIEMTLPPLASVRFEPKDGWDRKSTTVQFEEPLEAFGQEITEGVGTVVWSGGEIEPGEFLEFGFSAAMPAEETTLTFEILQTYSDGEVAKWTGAPDSESPAAQVNTYDIGAAEGEGQVAVLAALAAEPDQPMQHEMKPASTTGVTVLASIGAGLGLVALIVALTKKPKA